MAKTRSKRPQIYWFFRREPDRSESAFGVERGQFRSQSDFTSFCDAFRGVLEYLPEHQVTGQPTLGGEDLVIIGPRLDFPDTPFSQGAVEIAHQIGFPEVSRIEQFHCFTVPTGTDRDTFTATLKFDPKQEAVYINGLPATFRRNTRPPRVKTIDLLGKGRAEIDRFVHQNSLGLKNWQLDLIEGFYRAYGKNPTDLALYNLSQAWSDHCWHILFMMTSFVIDGDLMPATLIENLKAPYEAIKGTSSDNTEIVLNDNASSTTGTRVKQFVPRFPGTASELIWVQVTLHILFSAETHNYPGQVAPKPGAATEIGGEIRDQLGAGQGSDITHAGCVRVVGSLAFPNGYRIPGEFVPGRDYSYPSDKATPIEILVEGARGWVQYANAFGRPLTLFEMYSGAIWRPKMVGGKPVWERIESLKPVCYGLGVGSIHNEHKRKSKAKQGHVIVRIGGGARPVGFCGGSGSSTTTGSNTARFDMNAVQRGNAGEERAFYEVIRACVAMGRRSPIKIIHDQGAGGLGNMTSELIGEEGGCIFLGAVTTDDPSMGDIKVYVAEWQESQGLVIEESRLGEFRAICQRENCTCDVIGYITGTGRLEVFHEASQAEVDAIGAKPVYEIATSDLLTKRRGAVTIEDETPKIARLPLQLPELTFEQLLRQVLHRSEVASVDWFLRLVDQSVGAQVVKGPYCGPYQTPLPNYSVVALSNADTAGQATAIGMAPFATCLDAEAGVRLSIGRLLTRLMLAGVDDITKIKVLCNWMWPANISPPDGEVALLYKATQAVRDTLITLATAIIGGKDSPSMATWVNEALVKSIETVVFSASVLTDNMLDHLTGDIKHPGESHLIRIDFARGNRRLGGSSLGLSCGQLGDYAPDLDNPALVSRSIPMLYKLITRKLVTAGLEIGQGGLAATVAKMCFAGGCGATVSTCSHHTVEAECLAEELGIVVECPDENLEELERALALEGFPLEVLGPTNKTATIRMTHNSLLVLHADTRDLRRDWEETSHQLWRLIVSEEEADNEWANTRLRRKPICVVTAPPVIVPKLRTRQKPRAVVLRARGSNGQQEFAEALSRVGFRVDDVHFSDLLEERVTLDPYQLLAVPGGWADMDVFGAAMGMYLRATRNPHVKEELKRFMARKNTLFAGICNGAQFGLRMGYAPLPALSLSRERPLFTDINLGHFNHQWVTLRVDKSPSIFTQGLTDSIMPGVVANGEGRFNCSAGVMRAVLDQNLVAFSYVDPNGERTTDLPHCPSGSFVAGVTDPSGRHLAMMPHVLDRLSLLSRMSYVPKEIKDIAQDSDFSPWMHLGLNALKWCLEHR